MTCFVYILSNKKNGTLYIGSTSDLIKRVWQHKNKLIEGFTKRYSISNLVYFEQFNEIFEMAQRERRLKEWKRAWKINLIEKQNPQWKDLYMSLL